METIKRGDVYLVDIPYYTGFECKKTRPAVIVSNDILNSTSPLVTVVYCSATNHKNMVTHVDIGVLESGHEPSTALCEGIYTVDKSRLIRFYTHLSGEIMERIDSAVSLALGVCGAVAYKESPCLGTPKAAETEAEGTTPHLVALVERDLYKRLYNDLLERTITAGNGGDVWYAKDGILYRGKNDRFAGQGESAF